MADPIQQIFAQAGAASAGGEGFGQFAAQGFQLGLARRRLDFEARQMEREEQRQSMLLPLQEEALRLRNTATGIEIEQSRTNARYELGLREADLRVSQLMGAMAEGGRWGTPESWQAWDAIVKQVPLAAVSKSGQLFLQQQRIAMESERLTKQFGQPTQVTVPTAAGGQVQFGSDRQAIAPGTLSTFGKQLADYNALVAGGKQEEAQLMKAKLISDAEGQGLSIEFDDQGRVTRFVQGTGAGKGATGGPTTSTSTVAQRSLSQQQKTLVAIDELRSSLRPKDVGAAGWIGEHILDDLLPQVGVPSADTKRIDHRQKLKLLREGALRMVTTDDRFSNADRQAVQEIFPNLGVKESFESSVTTLDTLRRVFAKRSLIDAQTLKQAPPPWALDALDDEGLVEAENAGLLTEEDAIAAYKRKREKR